MKILVSIKSVILLMFIPIFMGACTPVRYTYATENLKGNAIVDKENMVVDYGKFAIQYSCEGGVIIINKSDSMMYIDMAESYHVLNGTAQQLYTNSVTTDFSSGSRGATVNLGSITNALGVGGVVGTLAHGVNVGGSNTSGSSTQIFEERYISIPPMSRRPVKSAIFEQESREIGNERWRIWKDTQGIFFDKKGNYNYTSSSSPAHEYIFSYTFNLNSKFQSTRDLLYVSNVEIDKSLKRKAEQGNQVTQKTGATTAGDFWMLLGGIYAAAGGVAALVIMVL